MYYYFYLIATYVPLYFILSLSLNLIVGFTGQLSLGHAAFFAVGAYSVGILSSSSFWGAWLLGAVFSALLAFLLGCAILRLRGDYLAIATLGFGQVVTTVIQNWDQVTNGPLGITGIVGPRWGSFILRDHTELFTLFVWILALLVYLFCNHLLHSRVGRAMEAIREDEIAAGSVGIRVFSYKLTAFVLGAFFAALAGGIYAVKLGTVSHSIGDFNLSVLILSMVVLGGMGSIWGSLLGAAVLVLMDYLPLMLSLTNLIPPTFNRILYGLMLIILMIKRPQGFLPRRAPKFYYQKDLPNGRAE